MNNKKKLVYILLADKDDQFITTTTLKDLEHEVDLLYFQGSEELFAALEKQLPSIILIDYNISPEPGVEILKQLKSLERFSAIPVIILTDSQLRHHHALCYSNGASTVIRKPGSMKMTTEKINTFFDYWINVAETL